MYKNEPSHFIGLVICFGDLFCFISFILRAEMEMDEKGFILVVALAHSGRAGGEDQVLLLGLVDHTVHREAGELLGAGLILLGGFSLVQLHLYFSRLLDSSYRPTGVLGLFLVL